VTTPGGPGEPGGARGPVLELSDVSKEYRGLRPLRIASLTVLPGEHLAILGLDQTTTEVFVNLITGATLPDRGDVRLFGRSTAAIEDSADWLAVVDRFGIVSRRAVLLDGLTVVQNLAMPFTLEIEPPPDDIRRRALVLAQRVGLPEGTLDRPVAELGPSGHVRVRLGRALALDPAVVILEHPTAEVPPEDVLALAALCRNVPAATIALTADPAFGEVVGDRCLTLNAATGILGGQSGWFSRLRRG
jgi:ABC-type transporter Mla maintaining outer membrane lipid asymmetry ATPase subunit MlaF